jgi:ssDNA-binding Zn-finger/Zn-ribbon topoisomerase 1
MTSDIKCPICEGKTTLLTAKKGPDTGKQFHVCNRYPECKGKIPFKDKGSTDEDFSMATGLITESQKNTSGNQQQDLWYQQFKVLFSEADLYITAVLSRDFQGLSEDFNRILKTKLALEPIRDSVKNLPNVKNGDYRHIRKDFEKLLDACIKAGDMALKSIEDDMHGARTAAQMHDATVRNWLTAASQHYVSLRKRLDLLSK